MSEPIPFRRFRPRDPERPRVLISRLSAIGDTILTLPVACRLRERFPDAYLAWLVEEKSAAFVRDHPALDEVIVARRGWFTKPREIAELRRRLQPLRFDAAFDCQGLTKSALGGWLSGAPLRAGFRGQHGGELSPWLNNTLIPATSPHVTDRSLELLQPLGLAHAPGDGVAWGIRPQASAEEAIAAWLGDTGDRPFAVINPGATWPSKLWSMPRFGELAQRLRDRFKLPTVVVWGGRQEEAWAAEIVAASDGAARLSPPTTLHELAALLGSARLMVSSDTGPMHLAVAMGAPTVGLHGATRPCDCGPYGPPNVGLLKQLQTGGRRERRTADNTAMLSLTVDDVFAACSDVLGRTAERAVGTPPAKAS